MTLFRPPSRGHLQEILRAAGIRQANDFTLITRKMPNASRSQGLLQVLRRGKPLQARVYGIDHLIDVNGTDKVYAAIADR